VEKQTPNVQPTPPKQKLRRPERPTSNAEVPDLRKERGLMPQQLENVDSALSFCFQRNMACDELAQVQLLTGVVDVDPD
jgi:hypothetical protein